MLSRKSKERYGDSEEEEILRPTRDTEQSPCEATRGEAPAASKVMVLVWMVAQPV